MKHAKVPGRPARKAARSAAGREERKRHVPVLLDAVVEALAAPNAVLIDGTLGDGGHAAALLDASGPKSRLLGIDMDTEGLARATQHLAHFGPRVATAHETFAHIADVARAHGFAEPTGILLDLGMSTHHLGVDRGFSFRGDGPLDMRFDPTGSLALPAPEQPELAALAKRNPAYTAADILAQMTEGGIRSILTRYSDERHAPSIAKAIATARKQAPITTVSALVDIIVRALPAAARHKPAHAATKTFQALRIAVNREVETIHEGIREAMNLLPPNGTLAVITFHSGEDRIIKQLFRDAAKTNAFRLVTKHPIKPTYAEQQTNRWSRSAHLRILQRI